MRQETLTTIKGGLNRLRTKGAALKDSLFELLNGYITTEKTIKARPGTILDTTLPAGTFGLVAFDGVLNVFATSLIANIPNGYKLHILRAPDNPALTKVHFAEPFLGALYVAAEFVDGNTFHFWLSDTVAWEADHHYRINNLVNPIVPNSYRYRATRKGNANIVWTGGAERTVGDRVEPTVANGFYFEAMQIFGANPRSGDVEPLWGDVVDGTFVDETVDGTVVPTPAAPSTPPDFNDPGDDINDRYGPGRFDDLL